jgi:hypothetical protein
MFMISGGDNLKCNSRLFERWYHKSVLMLAKMGTTFLDYESFFAHAGD